MSQAHPNIAYGIDFGTSNSTISVEREGRIQTIKLERDALTPTILRSLIYFPPNPGKQLFGDDAIKAYLNDIATGRSSKKELKATGKYIKVVKPATFGGWAGMEWVPEIIEVEVGDAGRLVQSLKSGLAASYLKNLLIFDKSYPIEEVVGMLMRELKKRADAEVGADVTSAVIGKPVHFVGGNNELAETRLREAAKLAGFTNVRFEFEPVGAAWKYASAYKGADNTTLVFDFGGGTLDFTIIKLPDKKILINDGLPLGGDLLNSRIFSRLLLKYFGGSATFGENNLPLPSFIEDSLSQWYKISLLKTSDFLASIDRLRQTCSEPQTMDALYYLVEHNLGFALYEAIDKAKINLSTFTHNRIQFDKGDIHIDERFSREDFEEIIKDDLTEISKKIDSILAKVSLESKDINTVVTTGGSSLIPKVQELLKNKFPGSKIENQDPFSSVSEGLAMRAREFTNGL